MGSLWVGSGSGDQEVLNREGGSGSGKRRQLHCAGAGNRAGARGLGVGVGRRGDTGGRGLVPRRWEQVCVAARHALSLRGCCTSGVQAAG